MKNDIRQSTEQTAEVKRGLDSFTAFDDAAFVKVGDMHHVMQPTSRAEGNPYAQPITTLDIHPDAFEPIEPVMTETGDSLTHPPIHPVEFPRDAIEDILSSSRVEPDAQGPAQNNMTTFYQNASLGNAAAHVMESMASTRGKTALNRKDALLQDIFFLIDKGVVWSGVDPRMMDEASLRAAIAHLKQNVDVLPTGDSPAVLEEIHARVSHHLGTEPMFFSQHGMITPEMIAEADNARRGITPPLHGAATSEILRVKSSKFEGVEYTSDMPGVITMVDPATGEVYMDVTGAIQLGVLSDRKFVQNKEARKYFADIQSQYAAQEVSVIQMVDKTVLLPITIPFSMGKAFADGGMNWLYKKMEQKADRDQAKNGPAAPDAPKGKGFSRIFPSLKKTAAFATVVPLAILGSGAATLGNAPVIVPEMLKANPQVEQPKQGAEAIVDGIIKKHTRTPRADFVRLKSEQAQQTSDVRAEKKVDAPKPTQAKPRTGKPSGPSMIA